MTDAEEQTISLAAGMLIKIIRQYVDDPPERIAVARAYGEAIATLVNDPTWSPEKSGVGWGQAPR